MNNDKQITITIGELDKFLFEEVITAVKPLHPEDHRAALKLGMSIVDAVMAKFDDVAKRAAKSEAARKAVAARWAPPAAPADATAAPTEPEKQKRKRRTKAEMEAAKAAATPPTPVAPVEAIAPPPPPAFAPPPPAFAPAAPEAPAAPTFG
jgi:hypothetical protein